MKTFAFVVCLTQVWFTCLYWNRLFRSDATLNSHYADDSIQMKSHQMKILFIRILFNYKFCRLWILQGVKNERLYLWASAFWLGSRLRWRGFKSTAWDWITCRLRMGAVSGKPLDGPISWIIIHHFDQELFAINRQISNLISTRYQYY